MLTEQQRLPAEQHIASLTPQDVERYKIYFEDHVKPKTVEDEFRRFVFAFASVHTTFVSNCRMYEALKGLEWLHDADKLKARIIESGAGLHNNRTKFIHAFSEFFWQHPGWFVKSRHETWVEYRDRIERRVAGLGFAKSAFACELLYPAECKVLCTDVHVLRLYGINANKVKQRELYEVEKHWTDTCDAANVPATVARWSWWDKHQDGQPDSRYWAFVFEKENWNERLSRIAEQSTTV